MLHIPVLSGFVLCSALVLGPDAIAQNVLYTVSGDAADDRLGAVSGAGDVNNDGYSDFIVGAFGSALHGARTGMIRVYSGQTGAELFTRFGDAADNWLGSVVSGGGDVNNDGFTDVIAGAHKNDTNGTFSGMIRVYSGQDGSVLYDRFGDAAQDFLGLSVSDGGDVNNDGFADFIAGSFGNDTNGLDAGMIRVYSGQSGAVLYDRFGIAVSDVLGSSVSGGGDVDNDGFSDFMAGAQFNDTNGSESGMIRVYSGQTGNVLYDRFGDAADDWLGSSVSDAGDVDNDGCDDFMASAPFNDSNGTDSGLIRVYSGLTGSVLYSRLGDTANDWFGTSMCGAGDLNNDGHADFIGGTPWNDAAGTDSGLIRIFSGQTGAVLFSQSGDSAGDSLGLWGGVSAAGDVNADGINDIIAGASGNDLSAMNSGLARVFTGPCARIESYGIGCLGAADTHIPELLIETDCWGTGGTIRFKIQNAWGGGLAFLLASTQRASVPWTNDCVILVQAPWAMLPLGTLSDAGPPPNGNGSMDLPINIANPLTPGSLTLQVGIVQLNASASKNLTNGVEISLP